MQPKATSLRPFIGAKNFDTSRSFYLDLGFQEVALETNLSVFKRDGLAFYLQRYYARDWIDNTMLFMEVDNVEAWWAWLQTLKLVQKYPGVKLVPIRHMDWGSECFIHDPSGILWHIGSFNV